jgi:hypothetical protein
MLLLLLLLLLGWCVQSGTQGFLGRINRLQSEKADLEAQLATAKDNINYLQVGVGVWVCLWV